MFSIIKKTVLSLAMLALVFPFVPAKAATGGASGLIISPPITEKQVELNATYNGKIKVTNPNADTTLKVTVTVSDFKANGEEGDQTFVDPVSNATFALGAWITIEKEFTLAANETKEVTYSVKVPANAEPGGHYGVIFFSPEATAAAGTGASNVTAIPKVGSLLLFTVPGDIKYAGSIAEFSVNKKLYIESKNKVDLVTRFQNLSSNHVKPQGNIVIKNLLGKEVATLAVNEKMGNVLPDSIRRFENSWEKKYAFGMYKASVTLAFGDSGSATANLSFWVIPWKETVGVVIILIVLIWLLSHLRWGKGKQQTVVAQPAQTPPVTPPTPPTPTQSSTQTPTDTPQTPPQSTDIK